VVIAIAGLVFGREAAGGRIIEQMEGLIGHDGASMLQAMIQNAWTSPSGDFAALFKVLPDVEIRWKDVWPGAAITAGLFNVGKFAIGMYLGHSGIASAYGAAGSLAVLLMWIYYSAQILLFGAEFTRLYAERQRTGRRPQTHAERRQQLPPGRPA
jgi:uncharacterized BrkB/YihY/UPF0761 family membrane protein